MAHTKMNGAVIVTGASRGLGREIAIRFGIGGFPVVVNYHSGRDEANSVVSKIEAAGGKSFSFKADVSAYEQVEGMVKETLTLFGRIDVLVNNAGIARPGLMLKLSEADWQESLDVNLKGAFNTLKAVSKPMMKARSGHIINVSSILGVKGKAGQAAYSASKAGLIGLTKAAGVELAPRGISVNAVLPGYMLTDMGASATRKAQDEALSENLLKRFSEPSEVADFIFHIARMKAVSGQVFNLDSRIL